MVRFTFSIIQIQKISGKLPHLFLPQRDETAGVPGILAGIIRALHTARLLIALVEVPRAIRPWHRRSSLQRRF